jgi:TolB-like protein
MPNKLSRFWQELKRRKVIYFLIGYVAACFAIIEFFENTSNRFAISDKTVNLLYILASIGLPAAIIIPLIIFRKQRIDQTPDSQNTLQVKDNSIIVLPFANISPDPDQEYFSDGLTEEIITDLSQIQDLLVISRSSAMTFKGTDKKISEITREVHVQYALEGSVRKEGNQLRIVAQLIDAETDTHLWAEKYSGTLEDVFKMQEKVSRSIANALKIKLSQKEKDRISAVSIQNIEVYDYYYKAKHAMGNWTLEEMEKAEQLLQEGIEIIGANTLLYSQLGHINYQYWNLGYADDETTLEIAADYSDKIFDIEPGSVQGYFLKGTLEMAGGQVANMIRYFQRVLNDDPNNADALIWTSIYLIFIGKTEMAHPYIERFAKIDPMSMNVPFLDQWADIYKGRFHESLRPIKKLHESNPAYLGYAWLRILVNSYLNRKEEALTIIENFRLAFPENIRYNGLFGLLKSALEGQDPESLVVSPELEKWAKKDVSYALFIAECFSLVNLKDKALNWLEISINLGGINFPFLNEYNTLLENIRREPRFRKLLLKVHQEWMEFKI